MQQMVGGGEFLQHAMRVFIHVLLCFFFNGDDEDEDVMVLLGMGKMVRV